MLEIRPARAAIVLCMGEAGAWAATTPRISAAVYRIARDERWLVGPAASREQLLDAARAQAQASGPKAYAVDVTDGWAVWTVVGPRVDELWARLSENPVPPGRPAFVQGAVASVPARAIIQDAMIHFFVPSPVGHHLPQRVLEAASDLGVRMAPAAELTLDAIAVAPLGVASGALSGARP